MMYFSAIFADFISPYPYDMQNKRKSYHPPTPIHLFSPEGFSLRPFVYEYKIEIDQETFARRYVPDQEKKHHIYLFTKGGKHKLLGVIPTDRHLFGLKSPRARIYLLGSDIHGRDIFSRILYGGRISLSIGLVGVAITFTIGLIMGGISGYFGGIVDNIVMRLSEMIMMVPSFYLLLALRAAFPLSMSSVEVFLMIIVILSFISWAGLARVIRGLVLSIRQREYVQSALALGAGNWRVIVLHVLPNTFSYAVVAASLSIPGYILGESGLSLLGLGIREPQASWGNMLNTAINASAVRQYPWILIPGFVIFIAIMAFNFLGDGLRDAFDPHGLVQ
jgi:peptide/nickel transport system permease protein